MGLTADYSLWLVFLCIALGGTYAFFLYFHRDRYLTEISPFLRRALFTLRFLFVSLISFFLLGPVIRNVVRTVEKPVLIVAQDNSESLTLGKDAAYYKTEYLKNLNKLVSELGEKFEVRTYSVGDKVKSGLSINFRDKQTDLSQVFTEISQQYGNRNVGAVILASDGIFNRGSNPFYEAGNLKAPVYTVAMGDTTVRKDLFISRVNYNRTSFLGNKIPVEVIVNADKLKGTKTTLKVSRKGEMLFSREVDITSLSFSRTISLLLDARHKGINHFTIEVVPVREEATTLNNTKDIYIDVLEKRQKILCLSAFPHPDIAAVKRVIEGSDNYELKIADAAAFSGNLNEYNLVIFYQLPGGNNQLSIAPLLKGSTTSILFILGAQTNVKAFNELQGALKIEGNSGKTNETEAVFNDEFSLFTLSEGSRSAISKFPPLLCPFGIYRNTGSGLSAVVQKIGRITSEQPLVFFFEEENRKAGVITGEGLWKWRMKDHQENGNFRQFDEIILKLVQYLSLNEEKKHLRIIARNNYFENEPVQMDAEVYNESYELVNNGEVSLTITDENRKSFSFTFSRTEKAYTLNIGHFPLGEYEYTASTKIGNKTYTEAGIFSISPLQIENNETTADHQLLFNIAEKTGGRMFYPRELGMLADTIGARDVKPVSYSESRLEDLINLKWPFFILLALISLEWFLRKRNGAF
jgi:hypothetical protein